MYLRHQKIKEFVIKAGTKKIQNDASMLIFALMCFFTKVTFVHWSVKQVSLYIVWFVQWNAASVVPFKEAQRANAVTGQLQ